MIGYEVLGVYWEDREVCQAGPPAEGRQGHEDAVLTNNSNNDMYVYIYIYICIYTYVFM